MQSRAEFVDKHWEEAVVIDAKMREAAVACVKNFLGEDQDVPTYLTRERLEKCASAVDIFIHLGYCYALIALDQRFLKQRTFIEQLFNLCIIQAALGESSVVVVIRSDARKLTPMMAIRSRTAQGMDRLQISREIVRFTYDQLGYLPKTPIEVQRVFYPQLLNALHGLWKALWRKKRTDEERERAKDEQADGVQRCIESICMDWKIECLPEVRPGSWMLEEFPCE